MNKVMTATTGKRLLAFLIDMILIGIVMSAIVALLRGPLDGWLHFESLNAEYIKIGQEMGVFDEAGKEIANLTVEQIQAFNKASESVYLQLHNANVVLNVIAATISGAIFEFIVPAAIGEGRTIGKLATKLRVVKKDGSKIGILDIFLRGFVGFTLIEYVLGLVLMLFPKLQLLSIFPFALSAVLVLSSNSKRAIHDYVSGTVATFAEGFEPNQKQVKQGVDPYHKSAKGFEYIDIEALEAREREAQERMAKAEQANNNDVIDNVVEPEQEKVEPQSVSEITMDDIERKEQEALERMKNKENNK